MLTEKEMEILNLLIREAPNYTTYPAEVEKRTFRQISRAGARLACERLAKVGILRSTNKRSQTWAKPTPHYQLPEDKDTFVKIVREYFNTLASSNHISWQSSAMFFMGSPYARRHITANLVRDVLSSRKVEVRMVAKMEKSQGADSDQKFNNILISFPVMPAGGTAEDMKSKVDILNNITTEEEKAFVEEVIRDHYSNKEMSIIVMPILLLLEISPTSLEFFLGDWAPYENGLVHVFNNKDLFGKIAVSGELYGFEMIEHLLFRLIWGAVSDLSLTRRVPENEHVLDAYVSGGRFYSGKQPLLRLSCRGHYSIEYEAGFDTEELLYGGEDDGAPEVVERNPENCTVRMTVTQTGSVG